jgi:hypothetical protein
MVMTELQSTPLDESEKFIKIQSLKDERINNICLHFVFFSSGYLWKNGTKTRGVFYVILNCYAWLSYVNVFTLHYPELEKFHNNNLFGALTIIVSWIISYLIGGIDLWLYYKRMIREIH